MALCYEKAGFLRSKFGFGSIGTVQRFQQPVKTLLQRLPGSVAAIDVTQLAFGLGGFVVPVQISVGLSK